MNPLIIQGALTAFKGIISLLGGGKIGQGELPANLTYANSYRLTKNGPDNDGNIIIDKSNGVPVARWSYKQQDYLDIAGFSIQGVPLFSNNPYATPSTDKRYSTEYVMTQFGGMGDPAWPFPNSRGGTRLLWDDYEFYGALVDPITKPEFLDPVNRGKTVAIFEMEQRLKKSAIGAGSAVALGSGIAVSLGAVSPWVYVVSAIVGGILGDRFAISQFNQGFRESPPVETERTVLPRGGGRA